MTLGHFSNRRDQPVAALALCRSAGDDLDLHRPPARTIKFVEHNTL